MTRLVGLLSFVLITAVALWPAQLVKRGAPAQPSTTLGFDGPELVADAPTPTIRLNVAHMHTFTGCGGYLYVTADTIRYEVVGPSQDKGHSFELRRSELRVAGQWTIWGQQTGFAELKFHGAGTYHFGHVRKSWIEHAGTARLSARDLLSYMDIVNAINGFDDVLATLEARAERLKPKAAAPPSVISMLEPAGAEAGRFLEVRGATLHLRGVASHASGIASVTVNGQLAYLKPLAPQTVEFDLRELPLNAGATPVVIAVAATDNSQAQMIFTANRAEVRLLEPAANSQTTDPTVRVRGLVLGMREVDRVEIAGLAAALRPAGSDVEFEAAAVPVKEGVNTLRGFVVSRSGAREEFAVEVKRVPKPGPAPLTRAEILEALNKGVPAPRLSSLVGQFGVDFALTDEAEQTLRAAGADANLLLAIAKNKR